MMQRRFLLLALGLLLIPLGMVAAQSSTHYANQRFVVVGGGSADSASFSVTSVIGQPATDLVGSSNYKVSGGFLHPLLPDSSFDQQIWLPTILK